MITLKTPFLFGNAIEGELFTDRAVDCERLLANFQNGINTILVSRVVGARPRL